MVKISIQYFGGRGSSSGRGGAANKSAAQTAQSTDPNAPNYVSSTSTGGKIVDMGGGHWEAENDNGSGVSILDSGNDLTNLYKYGSKQIYEVLRFVSDAMQGLVPDPPTLRVSTKAEAMAEAKKWLKQTKYATVDNGLIAGT